MYPRSVDRVVVQSLIDFVGVGFFIATPLFQTNLLPDFMQVKVLLPITDLIPTLVHLSPALTAAFAGIRGVERKRESIEKNAISFLFISKAYEVVKLLQEGIRPYLTYIRSISSNCQTH